MTSAATPQASLCDALTATRRAAMLRALDSSTTQMPDDLSPETAADIPQGDMPGDVVQIWPTHARIARHIYPALAQRLRASLRASRRGRAVVAIAGGSGAGKTGVAAVLAHHLRGAGIGTYTLSGDNYVWRVPHHNDAERLGVFRLAGARGLAEARLLTAERGDILRDLQVANRDAAPSRDHAWLAEYQRAGRDALADYLGTPREIDFTTLSATLARFGDGADELMLRRTGREDHELWFEPAGVAGVDVLVVEWTHALSPHLHGVDVGVYLDSTPERTLARRLERGRNSAADSPFVAMVLDIEQSKLAEQARSAAITVNEDLTHA